MARPSNADAQRILTLLDELQNKLEIVAMLSYENINKIAMSHQTLEEVFPKEVIEALMEHATLLGYAFKAQEQEEKEEESQEEDQEDPNQEQQEAEDEEDKDLPPSDLNEQLRKSTLDVVRMLSNQREPTTNGFEYLQSIRNVRQLFQTKLSTAVEEENSREKQLEEVKERLQKAQQDESQNKTALEKLRNDRNKTKQAREAEIKKLNEEIEKQKEEAEKQSDLIQRSAMSRLEKLEEENTKAQERMQSDINDLELKLKETKDQNKTEENTLRNNLKKVNYKVQEQINKFDEENQSYYDKTVRRTGHFETETSELKELKSRYDKLEAERKRLQEEMMKEEQMKNEFQRDQDLRGDAAAYIQAHWRGQKQRLDFEKTRKGRKKKGGAKKKK